VPALALKRPLEKRGRTVTTGRKMRLGVEVEGWVPRGRRVVMRRWEEGEDDKDEEGK